MTPFRNESRVLKETSAVIEGCLTERIVIVALHEAGLKTHERLDGAREVRRVVLSTRSMPTNLISQLFKYVEFAWKVGTHVRREKASLVSVHTVALLPIGVAVKFLFGCRLVYDAHELETETQGRVGLRKKLAQAVERLFIGAVDLTVVVSPGIEAWYRAKYRLNAIVTVLNCPRAVTPHRSNAIRDSTGIPSHRKVALYQGALTSGRGADKLIEAAPELHRLGYALVFMGYGERQDYIERIAKVSDTIYLLPAVTPDQVLNYTSSADIGICSIEATCLSYRLSLPNKLFEYAIAGVPVIASNLPEMAGLVNRYRIGACVDRWTVQEIGAAIVAIEALPQPELNESLRQVGLDHGWDTQREILIRAYQTFILSPHGQQ